MRYNQRSPQDTRRLLSGKDAAIFDEDGNLLATVDAFQAQVTWTNAAYQPLGQDQEHSHLTSYKVTLSITSCTIESDVFLRDMCERMTSGRPVWWTFQHAIKNRDDSEERVIYRDCVPDGQIDLLNAQVGEMLKRTLTLVVNNPPELQKVLSIGSW